MRRENGMLYTVRWPEIIFHAPIPVKTAEELLAVLATVHWYLPGSPLPITVSVLL